MRLYYSPEIVYCLPLKHQLTSFKLSMVVKFTLSMPQLINPIIIIVYQCPTDTVPQFLLKPFLSLYCLMCEWSGWQIWLKIILITAMWELDYLEKCGSSNPDFKEVGCLWKVMGFSISPCMTTYSIFYACFAWAMQLSVFHSVILKKHVKHTMAFWYSGYRQWHFEILATLGRLVLGLD